MLQSGEQGLMCWMDDGSERGKPGGRESRWEPAGKERRLMSESEMQ